MSSRKYEARNSAPRRTKFIEVGSRQVSVIASDATTDRMGDVLMPLGCRLENFKRNPVVLFSHDAAQPIARCVSITASSVAVTATIQFPPEGTTTLSDDCYRLIQQGVLGAVSVGFLALAWEPLPQGGLRFTEWELLELSIVSVPANPAAIITGKSLGAMREQNLARAAALKRRLVRDGVLSPPMRVPEHVASSAKMLEIEEEERRKDRAAAYDYLCMLGGTW